MTKRKSERAPTKKKKTTGSRPVARSSSSSLSRSLYADYAIWEKTRRPKWHPVKKMRYVFFRMISGTTVSDALKEIRWTPSAFWSLIDAKRNDVFRDEFLRAKRLQGRAFADSVVMIAEGRDAITRASVRKMHRLIEKGMQRAKREKNALGAKAIIEGLLSQIDFNDHRILGRNKLQMDAAKWIAKTSHPAEFSDTSKIALGGAGSETPTELPPLLIQFVGPDGKVIKP